MKFFYIYYDKMYNCLQSYYEEAISVRVYVTVIIGSLIWWHDDDDKVVRKNW